MKYALHIELYIVPRPEYQYDHSTPSNYDLSRSQTVSRLGVQNGCLVAVSQLICTSTTDAQRHTAFPDRCMTGNVYIDNARAFEQLLVLPLLLSDTYDRFISR
jgi:hypothetical protein